MKPTNQITQIHPDEAFFFELSSDLLAVSSQDEKFLRFNRSWEHLLGYKTEDLLRGKYIDLVHPDDLEMTRNAIQKINNEGKLTGFVNRYRKSDGNYVYLEWSADMHNGLVYSIARDVTKLKEAERELKESFVKLTELKDFQDALFNSITDVIGVQDLRHNVLMYNKAGYDFLGKSPDDVEGKKCFHLIDNDEQCAECATSRLYQTEKPEHVERYFEPMNKWLDVRAYPVFDQNGKLWRIIEHIRDISPFKQSQKELLDSQEYFLAVIDSINDAVFVDEASTGQVIYVNETCCRMYGYPKEEMLEMNIEAISAGPPDYTQTRAIDMLVRAKDEGPQMFEWLAKKADGTLFPVEVNACYAEIGKGAYYIVSVRDISKRKETEEALIKSEEKYRQLVDQAAEMLFLHDMNGNLLEVNLAACYQTEFSREELLSMNVFDIDPDAHDRDDLTNYWKSIPHGEIITIEVKHRRKSGSIYPAEVSIGKIVVGKEVSILALARDISARKNAELALLTGKANLEAVIENTEDLIWSVDAQMNIIFANSAFQNFYKLVYGHELSPGQSFVGSNETSDYGKRWWNLCTQTVESAERNMVELETYLPSGRFIYEFVLNPIKNQLHEVSGIAISGRNISLRKERESLIRKSNEDLKKANIEKDQLMSIIAHDLRSPFTTFLGFTEMLLDPEFNLNETKTKEILKMLRNSALSTFRLIENLLEWTRIQRGVLQPERIYTDFESIVNAAIASLAEVARSKEITIEKECMRNRHILADSNMMETVIRNLISNAIKFSYRNSKVVIQCLQEGSKLRLLVMDFGTGMSEDTKAGLFRIDPSKGMSGTEGERSSGLGLLICKELMEMHEGKIKVVSRLGKGSTFILELPVPEFDT
jgi:PAS domain S-box-containing protein